MVETEYSTAAPAGGDDTLVASTLTDSLGNYHFNNLSPGKYFVQQLPATGFVLNPGTGVSTVNITSSDLSGTPGVVIDSSTPVRRPLHPSRPIEPPYRRSALRSDRRPAPLCSYSADHTHGSVAMGANTDIPGMLDFSSGSASNGLFEIVWDGPGSDAQHLNPNGLNNVDLTAGNTSTGIELALGADHNGGTAVLTIYSDATDWSSATISIPNTDDGTAKPENVCPVYKLYHWRRHRGKLLQGGRCPAQHQRPQRC